MADTAQETRHAEILIIGSGPAGWTAAVYAARAMRDTLVVAGSQPGGQLTITTEVENYPGFVQGVLGPELMQYFEAQAARFGTELCYGSVTAVDFSQRPFQLLTDNIQMLRTDAVIIATGARPFVPPIPGLADIDYLTSDNLWSITEQPKKLLVMGAGPIGCELAQAFQRLGTQVTLVGRAARIMPREDTDVSNYILESFQREGVNVLLGQQIVAFKTTTQEGMPSNVAVLKGDNGKQEIIFDRVLIAAGRRAICHPLVLGLGGQRGPLNQTPKPQTALQ